MSYRCVAILISKVFLLGGVAFFSYQRSIPLSPSKWFRFSSGLFHLLPLPQNRAHADSVIKERQKKKRSIAVWPITSIPTSNTLFSPIIESQFPSGSYTLLVLRRLPSVSLIIIAGFLASVSCKLPHTLS